MLSLEILDDSDFIIFYNTITSQIERKNETQHTTIEPLTQTLI